MMAAIGLQEEGVGRNGVDSGAGRIYSMHKTLCTVADMGMSGHRGGEVYICARDDIHGCNISTI